MRAVFARALRGLGAWGSVPIVVPRWTLSIKYVLLAMIGLAAGWKGSSTLLIQTSEDYVRLWALGLTFFGLVSAFLSLRTRWERWERISSIGVVALLWSYVIAIGVRALDGYSGVLTFAACLLALSWFPTFRCFMLLRRAGIPQTPPPTFYEERVSDE